MLEVGALVGGDYRVERKLSEGGMGAVFVAEQVSTGAKRALKVIRPELLRNAKLRDRFAQEAKVTSRISSDHVVSVVAAGYDVALELPWIAMELLSGETLLEMVASRGPLSVETSLAILRQLSHAMDAAHEASVVHRDLKPDNVFLATSRRSGFPFFVKVLDFGIARIVLEAQSTNNTESLGTPLWMAPEQAGSGDAVGPWTDIWSFGLIAFFLLTGRSYWLAAQGETTTLAVVREVCLDPLPLARERALVLGFRDEIPPAFDAWFAGCVSRDVKARFPSAGVAVAALGRALASPGSEVDPLVESPRIGSARVVSSIEVDPTLAAGSAESLEAARISVAHAKTEAAPIPSPTPRSVPESDATPAHAPPPVSVTQPSLAAEGPPRRSLAVRVGIVAILALAVAGGVFGSRAIGASNDVAACRAGTDDAACERACERERERGDRVLGGSGGASLACARSGERGIVGRDAALVKKSADLLRATCARGQAEACGALGYALAYPAGEGLVRDLKGAAELLETACKFGYMCALTGAGRELGWSGLSKEATSYFDASCTRSPASAIEHLDCAWAVAHDLEGPPDGKVSPRLASVADADVRVRCTERPGDICALAWLDKKATKAETFAAYERGCDAGSALACNNLGVLRAEGAEGRPPNPTLARETFERACAAFEPAACNNLAFVAGGLVATPRHGPRGATVYKLRCNGGIQVGCAGWGETVAVVPKGTPSHPKEAVVALERACEAGLTTACVNLGAFQYLGLGGARDRGRAEKLFAESCFRGDASACGEQGAALLTLRMDHPRDVRAGFGFLERACKGGEEDSCMALYGHMVNGLPDHKREAEGVTGLLRLAARKIYAPTLVQLYETGGSGLPRNLVEARRIALATCESDTRCASAAYFLSRGLGGPRDEVRANEVLTRGCENDDFPSCTELGARHREGRGAGKDPTLAADLFKKACDGADAAGCDMLSRAYATADGVPRDPTRAIALARSACESGGAEGCATVGVMTAEGKGTEKNVDLATPYLAFGCRRAVQTACEKLQELKKPLPELDL